MYYRIAWRPLCQLKAAKKRPGVFAAVGRRERTCPAARLAGEKQEEKQKLHFTNSLL
ncbi:MAG TPA: hypothetical protein H9915_09300 [Candidatus Gemmiger faecigallinarum]|nr:hypothetical protein [Candidatus Gemmiger faecigallinarum]